MEGHSPIFRPGLCAEDDPMCPSQLPERDGATLLRDRVHKALQDLGGKTATQAIKDQVPFGDHDFHFSSIANPASLRVDYEVRCTRCRWRFRTSSELMTGATKDVDRATMQSAFYKLLKRFCEEVDPDCATAALMAIVTNVHDL